MKLLSYLIAFIAGGMLGMLVMALCVMAGEPRRSVDPQSLSPWLDRPTQQGGS